MCGICGLVLKGKLGSVDPDLLEKMNQTIVHRGPDDSGQSVFSHAGLAMRRLSIIDLSGGHQPIFNEDRTLSIVYNGEIYNYKALKSELISLGHRFTTESDTETVLHAFEQWGDGCLNRLNGMFAFAIWDEASQELFLARDPVGQKPLYIYQDSMRLLFASEIKALLAAGDIPREVDPVAVHDYLTYLYVPPPRTMLKGVTAVPPGHYAKWHNGTFDIHEYWAGPSTAFGAEPTAEVSNTDVLTELTEAVKRHMVSDVPVGCLLSGGIDSSAIAALMSREMGGGLKTFTAGFPGAGIYDERPHAERVARAIGSEHHEVTIGSDSISALDSIIWHLDEPLGDASVIPNYFVAGLAGKHVKTALSGIGGDEMFGGYQRYFAHLTARKWQRCPKVLRDGAISLASRAVHIDGSTPAGNRLRLAQKLFDHLDEVPERRYLAWNSFLSESMKSSLYTDDHDTGLPDSMLAGLKWFDRVPSADMTRRAMYVDLKSYLPGDPLLIADKMSMAHSLEMRVPFLDRELMELAFSVPASQHRSKQSNTKSLLRTAVTGLLPTEILLRSKQGFGTPIDVWLRGDLKDLLHDALSEAVIRDRGWFEPATVKSLIETHQAGHRDYSQHLWALLIMELWQRQFADSAVQVMSAGSNTRHKISVSEKRSLNILTVADVDPLEGGSGAERVLGAEVRELINRGHRVTILARGSDARINVRVAPSAAQIVRYVAPQGRGVNSLIATMKVATNTAEDLLSANRFDVLFVQQPITGAAVLRTKPARAMPVVYNYHSPWSEEYRIRCLQNRLPLADPNVTKPSPSEVAQMWVRENIEKRVATRANAVRILSNYMGELCHGLHGVPYNRLHVIPGGVDTFHFTCEDDRDSIRARLGVGKDQKLLLTVRGIETRMGLGNLVSSMPSILQKHADCILLIGGEGPIKASLQAQIKRLGLADHVRLIGFIPEGELPGYYRAADLFVIPTIALEGFGLVTIEALSCGTPVVGTPVGGTPEILKRLDSRMVMDGSDPNAIAQGVLTCLREVCTAEDMRSRCRDYVLDNYTWPIVVDQLEALLIDTVQVGRHSG